MACVLRPLYGIIGQRRAGMNDTTPKHRCLEFAGGGEISCPVSVVSAGVHVKLIAVSMPDGRLPSVSDLVLLCERDSRSISAGV